MRFSAFYKPILLEMKQRQEEAVRRTRAEESEKPKTQFEREQRKSQTANLCKLLTLKYATNAYMPNQTNQITDTEAQRFVNLLKQGFESIMEAGVLAAQAIDNDPEFVNRVCHLWPDLTPEFVHRIEWVGRRKIHPALALNDSPGVRALWKLPITLQERFISSPVKLLIEREAGQIDTLEVDVRNLTPSQVRQVFSKDRVRSESEQRAWIESERAKPTNLPAADKPWRVVGKFLVVLQPCRISKRDVARIVADWTQ